MIIGRTSESITPEERTKIGYLPTGANAYLAIEQLATAPATGDDGEIYYNSTDEKFYLWDTDAWVEVLFSMELVTI